MIRGAIFLINLSKSMVKDFSKFHDELLTDLVMKEFACHCGVFILPSLLV